MSEDEIKPSDINVEDPVQEVKKPKSDKKPFNKKLLLVLLVVVLLAATAGAAYWWRDKTANESAQKQSDTVSSLQKTVIALGKQLTAEKAKNVTTVQPTACTEVAPIASKIESIKSSITSGNTAALEGYMASSVNVILAASEAYGAQTPTKAVADISQFITSDINSWGYNFSLPAATLNTYKAGSYKTYFSTISVVGKAANNQVISFSFDCNGKIDTVFMAGDESLLGA